MDVSKNLINLTEMEMKKSETIMTTYLILKVKANKKMASSIRRTGKYIKSLDYCK